VPGNHLLHKLGTVFYNFPKADWTLEFLFYDDVSKCCQDASSRTDFIYCRLINRHPFNYDIGPQLHSQLGEGRIHYILHISQLHSIFCTRIIGRHVRIMVYLYAYCTVCNYVIMTSWTESCYIHNHKMEWQVLNTSRSLNDSCYAQAHHGMTAAISITSWTDICYIRSHHGMTAIAHYHIMGQLLYTITWWKDNYTPHTAARQCSHITHYFIKTSTRYIIISQIYSQFLLTIDR
jgi:hypothetical protein